MKATIFYILICTSLFASDDKKHNSSVNSNDTKQYKVDYSQLKDTLYTIGDYFIEVNLSNQMAYLHSRFDTTKPFGISSGTARLKDGMDTNEGVYAIQFKVERWHSVQFDSTLMLNFMTFNWGIGFHALAGNSYYKYLGVKQSSHGCVRVSREDAKEIYEKVKYGAPVLVHKGNPAVIIAFANKTDKDLQYLNYVELKNILSSRLQKLYKGDYLLSQNEKLLIDNNNVTHAGLPVGDGSKINKRQILKPDFLFIDDVLPELKDYEISNNYLISAFQMKSIKGNIPQPASFLEDVFE